MSEKKLTRAQQAKEILRIAYENGVEQNYFFITAFERYQTQLKILKDLEKIIKKEEVLVTKEYVKGRQNIYTHPAITEYNKTATAANQTEATLIKIITSMREQKENPDDDELLMFLQGNK